MSLDDYFKPFRENIIGREQTFNSPFGEQKIIYADWVASGRIYKVIEDVAQHHEAIAKEYIYNGAKNEFVYKEESFVKKNQERAESWFKL